MSSESISQLKHKLLWTHQLNIFSHNDGGQTIKNGIIFKLE
jgi:hypothetical protein